METQMLRCLLKNLESEGHLRTVFEKVDKDFQLGAILKENNNKVPTIFKNVNHRNAVVGGLFGNRELFFSLLKFEHCERIKQISKAIINPKPYQVLENGPIYENIITNKIYLDDIIPFTKFHEKDSGPFITAGILVIKEPESGKYLTSIRRLQYNGGNCLSLLVASPRFNRILEKCNNNGQDLEVAIFLGYDAEAILASQINSNVYDVDKYTLDSALRGEPLKLVRCKTKDLLVPAYSEIVLEGRVPAGKFEYEGPFGELMGYYGERALHPIIEIDAVMHRNNPIYQVAFPCREEHLTNGLTREVELFSNLERIVNVKDVYITEGGGYRFNAVVSIENGEHGEGKTAILGTFGTFSDIKNVVIVDEDVDIFSSSDVEWAITTRSQAGKDFVIIENAKGSTLDPSHVYYKKSDKLGIDATIPDKKTELFNRAIIDKKYGGIE